MPAPFVDIHCHLLPGIDDGAEDWGQTLEMAAMAAADGIGTIIVTPHQQGNFSNNRGNDIRHLTDQLVQALRHAGIPLKVLPGADVRIEDGMIERITRGEVLTLADRRRHLLLELPHELYLPLEPILRMLRHQRIVGILSHPERNRGILQRPKLLEPLVQEGCLMQVTAGSLMGTFGPESQRLAELMLHRGLVHFIATDAHGPNKRRPLMQRAYQRVIELVGQRMADAVCIDNPAYVAIGQPVAARTHGPKSHGWSGLFTKKKAG
jgi:protein-tyrosine phosphatase